MSLVGYLVDNGTEYCLEARSGTRYFILGRRAGLQDLKPFLGRAVRVRGFFSLPKMTIVPQEVCEINESPKVWAPKVCKS